MARFKKPLPSLEKLQHEIDQVKAETSPESVNSPPAEGLGQAMQLSVELLAGVLVGGILGYYLDQWLGTLPLFFIIGFFLGAAAGFRNILRRAKEDTEAHKEETEQ